MTLNDIIIRDLEACRREEEAEAARKAAENAHRDYDRAILRRLWGRQLRVIGEAAGGILPGHRPDGSEGAEDHGHAKHSQGQSLRKRHKTSKKSKKPKVLPI